MLNEMAVDSIGTSYVERSVLILRIYLLPTKKKNWVITLGKLLSNNLQIKAMEIDAYFNIPNLFLFLMPKIIMQLLADSI